MKILIILFCIVTTLAVLWMIGVPIYMKIKKRICGLHVMLLDFHHLQSQLI